MKDEFEVEISDGKIRTIYQEGIEEFAEQIGASVSSVCRLSHVEWEKIGDSGGWTVRSAHDPDLALRRQEDGTVQVSVMGEIEKFHKREEALAEESRFVWALLPTRGT